MRKLFALLFFLVFLINCQSIPSKTRIAPIESSYLSGYKKFVFHDEQRKKTLDVWVWYPVENDSPYKILKSPNLGSRISENGAIKNPNESKPLIVLSHGFRGSPEQFNWLIEPLVAAGYVVLATEHADFPPHGNHWKRSLDVTFILTEFLKTSLGKTIDQQRIGFAGYSLGGMTGISLAGAKIQNLDAFVPDENHARSRLIYEGALAALPTLDREQMQKEYRDDRIKAAFLMAPAWSWIFRADDVKNIHIPVYVVSGDQDEVIAPETNGLWFAKHISKAQFQWIKGAGHFIFLDSFSCEGRTLLDPDGSLSFLYEDGEGVDRNFVHEQVRKVATAFFDANL